MAVDKTYHMEDLTPEEAELLLRTGLTYEENYTLFAKTKEQTEAAWNKAITVLANLRATKEDRESSERVILQIIATHKQFLVRDDNTCDWRVSDKIYQEYQEWITPYLDYESWLAKHTFQDAATLLEVLKKHNTK